MEDSVRLAGTLAQYDPHFDARFAKKLLEDDKMAEAARQRGLAVLEKLGCSERLAPILIQFLRDPDGRIRSKAALMLGQTMPSHGIMHRLMGDRNARVRANFIEGLWSQSAIDFRPLFRMALHDPDHRVVGNAMVGLYYLGETRYVNTELEQMARRFEAPYRAVAAWVMGQTGDERFIGLLRDMASDRYQVVRNNALRALGRISRLPPAAGPAGDVTVQIPPEVK
jgi:HEAT repeat protein